MRTATLHLLLPFALPAYANFSAEGSSLASSALGKLLRRATLVEHKHMHSSETFGFQHALSHERWLTCQFNGLDDHSHGKGSLGEQRLDDHAPLAPYMLIADGGTPGQHVWACLQPVHLQIAHDHLVLANPADLNLCHHEASALLDTARPLIESFDLKLIAPTPWRWYVTGEALGELSSASLLCASGRNIEIWLPHHTKTGTRSHLWMKLQNEVQMAWFEHPINRARAIRGACAVNSIWLYAQGAFKPVTRPFTRVLSNSVATRGLGLAAQAHVGAPPATFAQLPLTSGHAIVHSTDAKHSDSDCTLIELDTLIKPSMQTDSTALRFAFATLEHHWFAPALTALQKGRLTALTLTLCGDTDWITLTVMRADLRKFWRRRAFVEWMSQASNFYLNERNRKKS